MSDQDVNEKIESLRLKAREFMKHEKESVTEYGGSMLREVEGLVIESVESASAKIDSILSRISESVRKEPFVALAAFAITGFAVVNLLGKRRRSRPAERSTVSEPPLTH
jgi:ElaB/YqjD/DUF883 family membrane-anchored ribosome-binding protein